MQEEKTAENKANYIDGGNFKARIGNTTYLYLLTVFYLFFYFLVTFVTYKRKPSKINTFTG